MSALGPYQFIDISFFNCNLLIFYSEASLYLAICIDTP